MRAIRPCREAYSAARRAREAARLARPAILLCAGLSLAGCSISLPIASLTEHEEETTGSINRPVSPLSPRLTEEDWRRARAALAVAVDPQGNGSPVTWDNPETQAKGSFVANGPLFIEDDKVCRVFRSRLTAAERAVAHEGSACRLGPGDWVIRTVTPLPAT